MAVLLLFWKWSRWNSTTSRVNNNNNIECNFCLWNGWIDLSGILGGDYTSSVAWLMIMILTRRQQQQQPHCSSSQRNDDNHSHQYYYWRSPEYHCRFDLCRLFSQGGEGRLYRGRCVAQQQQQSYNDNNNNNQTSPSSMAVLLKSYTGNRVFGGARLEAAATLQMGQWLSNTSTSTTTTITSNNHSLTVIGSGFNYLILTHLQGYVPVSAVYPKLPTFEARMHFCEQLLHQLLQQFHALHAHYLHLDISKRNILVQKQQNQQSHPNMWHFQLIDFSNALPVHPVQDAVRFVFVQRPHEVKLARAACLAARRPDRYLQGASQAWCSTTQKTATCPGLLDSYPLAIMVLKLLSNSTVITPPLHNHKGRVTIAELNAQSTRLVQRLESYYHDGRVSQTVYSVLVQLMDPSRLNATLICGP